MTPVTYLDFELGVAPARDGSVTVTLLRSPAGEARAEAVLPAAPPSLADDPLATPIELAQDFGAALFDALIGGEIRNRYDVSRQMAAAQGQGLRIKLRVDAPALPPLPWELLYDARLGDFVCLAQTTPLVRYVALPQPLQPLQVELPLRILGMVAAPEGLPPLDSAREQARVDAALAPLRAAGQAEWRWLAGQSWRALQQALQQGPWHIFHFVGHAGFDAARDEGMLLLAGEQNEAAPLYAGELARLLGDHRSLRLAVLNACEGARVGESSIFSSVALRLTQRGLPAVLAMQYPITDRAAIEFGQSFYGALAAALPVDAATGEARKAVSLSRPGAIEWATPVLHMRAPDGVLWQAQAKPTKVEETMDEKPAWWDQLPDTLGGLHTGDVGGSVIIGSVGAGARNVAIGQNITQTIVETLGEATPEDKAVIEAQFERVLAALNAASIDPRTAGRAEANLETLQAELTKTGDDDRPDAGAITRVGDWLLDNAPEIAQALAELFGLPAVGRVLGKAGEGAVAWVRRRFRRRDE